RSPFATLTSNGSIVDVGNLSLLERVALMKLCDDPLSTSIVTRRSFNHAGNLIVIWPLVPTIAWTEISASSLSTSIPTSHSSLITGSSSSESTNSIKKFCLHRCPGVYFSSHQKHSPFSRLRAISSSVNLFTSVAGGLKVPGGLMFAL
ncbi:Unknown protein, partial [Striga hermonthica]